MALTAVCAALAFLATTPYALLDRVAFLRALQFERIHYATSHFGMDGEAPRFYAHYLLSQEGLLVTLAVAAVVVVAVSAREKWRVATVLASFPITYGTAVALQTVPNDRTIMLILPPLAVLTALAVEPVAE